MRSSIHSICDNSNRESRSVPTSSQLDVENTRGYIRRRFQVVLANGDSTDLLPSPHWIRMICVPGRLIRVTPRYY
jgi:hypothetical protein